VKGYDDPCGAARALSVVGDRWALLVVRELLFGPKRFTELSRGLPTMSQNVLSQRLRQLEGDRVVRQRQLGPPASSRVYELTGWGRELEPVLVALGRWGSRIPLGDTRTELSVDALMLALKTAFAPERAEGLRARVQLRLGDDRFAAGIADGRFTVARGELDEPDATITAGAPALRSLVFAGRTLPAAVGAGDAAVDGDQELAARFLGCFPRRTPFATS
jgi:DNA-binding HxlR family transcriptional regulator